MVKLNFFNSQKATGGKGVDVILEMLADVNLDKDLDILAFRGRVVVSIFFYDFYILVSLC